MPEPLEELYLVWLYSRIADTRVRSPRKTYWTLFRLLFRTEFVWFVPNDDARIEDARELRYQFLDDAEIPEVDPAWLDMGCSYLELLIALARRAEFMSENDATSWFWLMLHNIGLDECNDTYNKNMDKLVEEVTDQITFRNYDDDGTGGLFPLRRPRGDQREVELWYQLNAYVMENC